MWLPSSEPERVLVGTIKSSQIPSRGYLRVLDGGNESVIFLKDELIVGAWNLNIDSLKEHYENKALETLSIFPESKIEVHSIDEKTFQAILELNEECKLPLPIAVDFLLDKNSSIDREELLSKFRIQEPSQHDVEKLIDDYKSKVGGG